MKRAKFSPQGRCYIDHLEMNRKISMQLQHYHDSYEIYLQLGGKRYVFFDDVCYILERGDMFILKPFEIHYAESREFDHYSRYVINFQPEVLKSLLTDSEIHMLLEEKLRQNVVRLSDKEQEDMLDAFKRAEEYSKGTGFLSDKLTTASVAQLVVKALGYSGKKSDINGGKIHPQVAAALSYINERYRETISIDDISAAVHMSRYHLSRMFHEATGATVMEYLGNVRLTRVHTMLINTDMALEEIAAETGFGSAKNLTRSFKIRYGVPPREFRKLNKSKP